ncbi:hypothetical protein Pst134EA_013229 [Puccinia striiformis f. sp. tritici]|uniref:hypothetical protein n=1 Tax=Puccinia striiformis f. sp. tritici TaxID=168172 RepID=UPI0020076467|nr:hypothetical protein Pst134EA_013229 [Puccinia striiformis f. sp. tritici]KAH9454142.1 hypothetical protein Pst134EB_014238 [Puccinia striiformis f. sp. tritici]KAH9465340.1 hypothetical protein Pst134EA_013229 [Puccinia striiformis f. sp. tritici]
MTQAYYAHSDNQHYPQQQPQAQPYYAQEDYNQYPPPSDSYHHHSDNTYPPDHNYHPDQAAYHPEYDPAYNTLDEKYPPNELYPPSTANIPADHPSMNQFNSTSTFASPTRGSVAAQMAAEGAIPEKAGLRMWRSDEHSGAFTRGGKSQSCRRCCCCTLIVIILLIVGIVAGFLLWVRPPNATFNGIAPPTAGNQVDLQPKGFLLNFDLNIGVTNPNFFGASFSKISAKAYYPLNKTAALGGGELENVDIKPHSNTTINFPFQINYTTTLDPNRAILADIASRCGFLGNPKSPIKISFDITLRLKVLAISISPTFSSSNTFSCPLKQSDFTSVLGGSQSLDALSNLLTGSSGGDAKKRRLARRSSLFDQEDQEEDQQIETLVRKAFDNYSQQQQSSQLVLSKVRFIVAPNSLPSTTPYPYLQSLIHRIYNRLTLDSLLTNLRLRPS